MAVGLVSAGLVYTYVQGLTTPPSRPVTLVPVVVPTRAIPARAVITPDMLERRALPVDYMHADAITDLKEAEGRITRAELVTGEPILRGRLFPPGETPTMTFAIPPGKRAVTVAVNEVIGVAGFVKPGDRVDVLGTFDSPLATTPTTVTILQDVEVLAISQEMNLDEREKARLATTVTLAVSLAEAERLTLAEERGSLRLVLRPAGSSGVEAARGVTARDVLRVPAAPPPAPAAAATSNTRATVTVQGVQTPPPPRLVEIIRGTRKEYETLK